MATLDALGIVVTNMANTCTFYRMVGLNIPPGAEAEGHVDVELEGGFRIMFDTVDVVQSFSDYEFPPPGTKHKMGLAVRCALPAEVDAMYAAIVAAGYEGLLEPFDAFWGQRYATVLDPDGNPVDLYAALS